MSSISDPQTFRIEHSTAYSSIFFWISRAFVAFVSFERGQRRIDHADGAIGHALAHKDAGRALGQLLLDQAELADGFAERLALLRVADRICQRILRATDARRSQLEAADVQDVERDVVALADLAQQVSDRHLAVGEDQRAGGRAANAELVLLRAHGKARRVALDQEGGELFAVDLGEDREQIGKAAVGDPHLLAVQDVVLSVGESTARVRSSSHRSRKMPRRARMRRSIRR